MKWPFRRSTHRENALPDAVQTVITRYQTRVAELDREHHTHTRQIPWGDLAHLAMQVNDKNDLAANATLKARILNLATVNPSHVTTDFLNGFIDAVASAQKTNGQKLG